MLSKRALVRLAELHEGNFAGLDIEDELAAEATRAREALSSALDEELVTAPEVRVRVRGGRASVEWPLDGLSADDVTATLSGRLFEVHAERRDPAREEGGVMLLPFELVPDETVASVDGGVLKLSGPLAKG